jgi:trehalose-6-phosphatase
LKKGKTLFLFDIDGTLCESRLEVKPNMVQFLKDLSQKKDIDIAVVSCTNMKNAKRELKEAFSCFKAYFPINVIIFFLYI